MALYARSPDKMPVFAVIVGGPIDNIQHVLCWVLFGPALPSPMRLEVFQAKSGSSVQFRQSKKSYHFLPKKKEADQTAREVSRWVGGQCTVLLDSHLLFDEEMKR
jgi:hypothetical protein